MILLNVINGARKPKRDSWDCVFDSYYRYNLLKNSPVQGTLNLMGIVKEQLSFGSMAHVQNLEDCTPAYKSYKYVGCSYFKALKTCLFTKWMALSWCMKDIFMYMVLFFLKTIFIVQFIWIDYFNYTTRSLIFFPLPKFKRGIETFLCWITVRTDCMIAKKLHSKGGKGSSKEIPSLWL